MRCDHQLQPAQVRPDPRPGEGVRGEMRIYNSLRWRLTALIAGGSVISAVIAAAGYAWVDLNRFWQHSYNEVQAVGNVVSDQVGPAITLGDRKAASEILASLRSDSLIHDVFLYDASGAC